MTERNYDRLPRWAAREIDVLKSDLEHWKAKAHEGPDGSDTFVEDSGFGDGKPLGVGSHVRFRFDFPSERDRIGRYLTARLDSGNGGELIVMGSDALQVIPWSSNMLKIRVAR